MKIRQYLPTGRVGHFQIAGVPERQEPDLGEINPAYLFGLIDALGGVRICFDRPTRDVNSGLNMWGEFLVNDSTCAPSWGAFRDDGCVKVAGF